MISIEFRIISSIISFEKVVEYGSLDHLMKNEDSLIRAIIEQAEGQKKEGDIE